MINSKCIIFEYKKYNNGIFNNFIDVTYIMTLNNNDRIKNIDEKLKNIIPTNNICFAKDNGFKKCNKILHEQNVAYDITDTFFNIINHSLENNYDNILILEDDFIFDNKIKDIKIINEISLFIKKNENDIFYFNLGPLQFLFYPNINLFNNIYKCNTCVATHATIYPKKIRTEIMKYKNTPIKLYDVFLTNKFKNYFYKYPLCYQIFPQTNNKVFWYQNNFIGNIIFNISNKLYSIINIDKTPQPGYNIIYCASFIISYTIFISLIIIILYIIYYIFFVQKIIKNKKIKDFKL